MIILCVLVVVFRAKRIAQYTNFPFYERDMDMGEDVNIVVLQEDGYREVEEQYVRRQRRKGMDTLVNLAMVLSMCSCCLYPYPHRSGKPTSSV